MSAKQDQMPAPGTPVVVKISGVPTPAKYHGWSEKYNMPLVEVGGKILPRAFKPTDAATPPPTSAVITPSKKLTESGMPEDTDEAEWSGSYCIVRNGWIRCFVDRVLKSKHVDRDFKRDGSQPA